MNTNQKKTETIINNTRFGNIYLRRNHLHG